MTKGHGAEFGKKKRRFKKKCKSERNEKRKKTLGNGFGAEGTELQHSLGTGLTGEKKPGGGTISIENSTGGVQKGLRQTAP